MTITTLLFDIGDVLIDIDWQRGYRKMLGQMKDPQGRPLSMEEITEKLNPGPYGSVWENFGMGKMTRAEFLKTVAENTGYNGDKELLYQALTHLFEGLPERIALLNQLIDNGYNVALISDTNEMHMSHIEEYIPDIFKNIPVEKRFYSHDLGLKKKNGKDIYEYVLSKLGIKAEEAVMIDDRIQNKPGADEIGLNFLLIQKEEDLAKALGAEPYSVIY